jgi:hypothetical protein
VRTFSWMRAGLAPGAHTVDVAFATSSSSANAGFRTLTVQSFSECQPGAAC